MYAAHTFDGLPALLFNTLFAAYNRTGVVDGCTVSRTTSSTSIDFDVASGTVQIDGASVSVTTQTVTLAANPSQYPRRDVIWVDATDTAQVRAGDPEPYEPSRDPDRDFVDEHPARRTFRPAPDDMDDVLGGQDPTGVVLATVVVPSGAGDATDLTDDDWTDRRVIVPSTAGSGSHDSLTDVSLEDHQPQRYAGANLQNNASTFDVLNQANGGTIDSDKIDGYDVYVQNTAPSTTDPYIRFEDE